MNLALGSGGSQLEVQSTFAGNGPITINTGSGTATVLVVSSSAPLVVSGTTSTASDNKITFDATSNSDPMPAASLIEDESGPYYGDAELTGFGPIDTVYFDGFQEANLNLGQDINDLTIDLDVPDLSVNTNQKVIARAGAHWRMTRTTRATTRSPSIKSASPR